MQLQPIDPKGSFLKNLVLSVVLLGMSSLLIPAVLKQIDDRKFVDQQRFQEQLARGGDETALSVLEETGTWLGIGLAGFVNVFNPEVVAVGGGAMEAGDLILASARREVRLRARPPSRDLVEIQVATLGPESGVLGAAALARSADGVYVLGD